MTVHAADDIRAQIVSDSSELEDPIRTDDASAARRDRIVGAGFLAAVSVLIGADAVLDCLAGAEHEHVALEAFVFVVAASGLLWLARRIRAVRSVTGTLRRNLASARADAAKWRTESQAVLAGLGAAIDKQFAQWSLSGAEREVGLLLLKGLALKDIAAVRETSERTVRQQALAIYRKAQVSGRAELSAFFLEDILLPR